MEIPLPKAIEEHIDQFSGRAWLLPIFLEWLKKDESEQIFLLTGGPGTGKSMIMSWLATACDEPEAHPLRREICDHIMAVHFCRANDVSSFTPLAFADHVANQLLHHVVGFDEALTKALEPHGVKIEVHQTIGHVAEGAVVTGVQINNLNLAGLTDSDSFDIAFLRPLVKLYQNGYDQLMLILVDALDEAWSGNERGQELVQSLSKLEGLPAQVKILVSSRPDPRVTMFFEDSARPFDLVKDAPDDVTDIYDFAKGWLLHRQEWAEDVAHRVAQRIESAAKGVFLYAYIVLRDEVPSWERWEDTIALELPTKLSGLYNNFFKRELGSDRERWFKKMKPLLGLIAVAQDEGVELEKLQQLLERDPSYELEICQQYLAGEYPDGPFLLFHESLVEFLLDDRNNNKHYRIEAKEMHQYFANVYQSRTDWAELDIYDLRYLPYHLAGGDQQAELEQLLLDFNYLQAKLNTTTIDFLERDFDLVPKESILQPIKETLLLASTVLAQDKNQLAGQLLGRLLGTKHSSIDALLEQAKNPQDKGRFLRPLTASLSQLGGRQVRVLEGHTGAVEDVSLIPNEQHRMVSVARDGTLRMWDLVEGTEIFAMESDVGALANVSVANDGKWAVTTALSTGEISFWDIVRQDIIYPEQYFGSSNRKVAIMPDNQHVIANETGERLTIWNLSSQERIREIAVKLKHRYQIVDLAIMPDGAHVALLAHRGSKNRQFYIVRLGTGEIVLEFPCRSSMGITISPDGKSLVGTTEDRQIAVWNISDIKKVRIFGERWRFDRLLATDKVAFTVTPDGEFLLASSQDMTIEMWHFDSGQHIRTFYGHSGHINKLAVTAGGKHAISASDDHTLRVWDLSIRPAELRVPSQHDARIRAIAPAPDGSFAISGSDDKTIKLWHFPNDQMSPRLVAKFDGHQQGVNGLAISSDNRHLISVSDEKTIKIWDISELEETRTVTDFQGRYEGVAQVGHFRQVSTGIATVPESNRFLAEDRDDGNLKLADSVTLKVYQSLAVHKWVRAIAVTPDGQFAIIADDMPWLTIWDLAHNTRNEELFEDETRPLSDIYLSFAQSPHGYIAVALSPNGKCLLAGSYDGTLAIWDWPTRRLKNKFRGHNETVTAVAVLPDNKHFVSTSRDANLVVWDLEDGSRVATFTDVGAVLACAVAPDGTIIAGGETGYLHFLRLEGNS